MKNFLTDLGKTILLQIASLSMLIGLVAFAAISWPSGTPDGEISGGKFQQYFDGFISKECGSNQVVSGFTSTGVLKCAEMGVVPITGTIWRDLDPNCTIDDITLGTQTWAGCNSTLGTGFEWGKKDDGTDGIIGTCYNYDGTNNASDPDCAIGNANMVSNVSAKNFFEAKQPDGTNAYGDAEYDTIWGKLYTWSNSSSACPTGRHVPSDTEWTTLTDYITSLNGGDTNIGWRGHNAKINTNNLANALKLPLSGSRYADGSSFYSRGFNMFLWSSTPSSTSAYLRALSWDGSAVYRFPTSQAYGFSVRCLKD